MMLLLILISLCTMLDIYGQTNNQNCIPISDKLDGQEVMNVVEKMPEYPGGYPKFYLYIFSKLKYPKEQKDIQTRINVCFIIDIHGRIRNECIYSPIKEKGISPLETAVLEILKSMPKWTPGVHNGKNVPVRLFFPIDIEIG